MAFNPSQPRDQDGKWTDAGSGPWEAPKKPSFFLSSEEKRKAIDDFDGLPQDAEVVVYHGTTSDNADRLMKESVAGHRPRGDVISEITKSRDLYVAPTITEARNYAGRDGRVVKIRVRRGDVRPSPEALATNVHATPGHALFHSFNGAVIRHGTRLNISDAE